MTASSAAALSGAGVILGRYRMIRPLGTGGSGSVWLVQDEQLGQEVALKIVPRDGKAGMRAEREAQAVARLRHPNIARVHAIDHDGGHVYVAYDYVPGMTARDAIRNGHIDDRGSIEMAAQVLDALGHAHASGIIHRDVKPANVLLAETTEIGALLLDFGLALVEGEEALTATGDVPGTLSYISPERLRGGETTPAADVWSVGVMLWEALAGRQLFFSSSPVEIVSRIEAGAPSLATERPDLPQPVIRAVDGALVAEPAERPAAKALARELREAAQSRSRRAVASAGHRRPPSLARVTPAAFAAAYAGLATALLPFFPAGWPVGIALVSGLAAFANARLGLLLALAAPILPLGDVSLGLATAYLPFAVVWALVFWRDARHGLLFAACALLGLVPGGLLLLPLAAVRAAGPLRQALTAVAGTLSAALLAGLLGRSLPLEGTRAPLGLGLAGSDDPLAVIGSLLSALLDHRLFAVEAVILAVATVCLPLVRRAGLLGIVGYGAVLLPFALLAPPLFSGAGPDLLAIVLGVTVLTALLGLGHLPRRGPGYTRSS